jgi:hypothetical protein
MAPHGISKSRWLMGIDAVPLTDTKRLCSVTRFFQISDKAMLDEIPAAGTQVIGMVLHIAISELIEVRPEPADIGTVALTAGSVVGNAERAYSVVRLAIQRDDTSMQDLSILRPEVDVANVVFCSSTP